MKALTAVLLMLAALSGLAQEDQKPDKRTLGKTTVDLAPIHKWIAKPIGERPMKHWKQVEIFELKQGTAAFDLCTVQIEKTGHDTILIAHLPDKLRGFLARVTQLTNEVARLERQIDKDQAAFRGMDWNSPEAAKKGQEIDSNQETAKRLQSEYNGHMLVSSEERTVLIMFTGVLQPVAGSNERLQVWDFGVKEKAADSN